MITIEKIDEVHLRVYADDPSIEQELSDFFTFEYPGARFTPQYRARLWDGKVRLYDIIRKTLPVGLIQYVIDLLHPCLHAQCLGLLRVYNLKSSKGTEDESSSSRQQ